MGTTTQHGALGREGTANRAVHPCTTPSTHMSTMVSGGFATGLPMTPSAFSSHPRGGRWATNPTDVLTKCSRAFRTAPRLGPVGPAALRSRGGGGGAAVGDLRRSDRAVMSHPSRSYLHGRNDRGGGHWHREPLAWGRGLRSCVRPQQEGRCQPALAGRQPQLPISPIRVAATGRRGACTSALTYRRGTQCRRPCTCTHSTKHTACALHPAIRSRRRACTHHAVLTRSSGSRNRRGRTCSPAQNATARRHAHSNALWMDGDSLGRGRLATTSAARTLLAQREMKAPVHDRDISCRAMTDCSSISA